MNVVIHDLVLVVSCRTRLHCEPVADKEVLPSYQSGRVLVY